MYSLVEDGLTIGHRKAIHPVVYLAQLIDQNLGMQYLIIFHAYSLLDHFLNEMIKSFRLLELCLL